MTGTLREDAPGLQRHQFGIARTDAEAVERAAMASYHGLLLRHCSTAMRGFSARSGRCGQIGDIDAHQFAAVLLLSSTRCSFAFEGHHIGDQPAACVQRRPARLETPHRPCRRR